MITIIFQKWKTSQEEQSGHKLLESQINTIKIHIREIAGYGYDSFGKEKRSRNAWNPVRVRLPYTTKKGGGHGIGLKNMLRMAKKYMGDLSFEQNGNEVMVGIMLQVA